MSEGFMLTVCEIYILTPKEKKRKRKPSNIGAFDYDDEYVIFE